MHVISTIGRLISQVNDAVGLKSGIALSDPEFIALLNAGVEREGIEYVDAWWNQHPDLGVRLSGDQVEVAFLIGLKLLGTIPDYEDPYDLILRWLRQEKPELFQDAKSKSNLMSTVPHMLRSFMLEELPEDDLRELAIAVRKRSITHLGLPERRAWDGRTPLTHLFQSEEIPDTTHKGIFFDQRFIDYLYEHPERLEDMHWRQFEYLCGEWFRRDGYDVDVSQPRGDGGIDVYARRVDENGGPELIIVQAKRNTGDNQVAINDVKALHSDLVVIGATRGCVATTTRLAKGALKRCEEVNFKIYPEERDSIESWLAQMNSHAMS